MARSIRFLVKDIEKATVVAAQEACVQIMNGLVKAGPAYSGRFASAWYAVPKGSAPGGPRQPNGVESLEGIYRYDKRNVPLTRFRAGTLYEIVNGSSYAAEAMDLVDGEFRRPKDDPIKDPFAQGERYGGRRGMVRGSQQTGAISTAPLDWWSNYNLAGSLNRDLARGMRQGFGRARGFSK